MHTVGCSILCGHGVYNACVTKYFVVITFRLEVSSFLFAFECLKEEGMAPMTMPTENTVESFRPEALYQVKSSKPPHIIGKITDYVQIVLMNLFPVNGAGVPGKSLRLTFGIVDGLLFVSIGNNEKSHRHV